MKLGRPRARRITLPIRAARVPPEIGLTVRQALVEDQADRDLTTLAILPRPVPGKAIVSAEAYGRLAGMAYAVATAKALGITARPYAREGAAVSPGETVLSLSGDLRKILAAERTLLNGLMHLSGVATATARAVRGANTGKGGPAVYATRKTLPGLRAIEKWAVTLAGGQPHRLDLASGILLKNNHLAIVPVEEAISRVRRRVGRRWPIEVEVRTAEDAVRAARAGANALLIDNQSPWDAKRIVRALVDAGMRDRVWVELSGGITPENVGHFRSVGADAVSLGSLTHSAPALPFHLSVLPPRRSSSRPA